MNHRKHAHRVLAATAAAIIFAPIPSFGQAHLRPVPEIRLPDIET